MNKKIMLLALAAVSAAVLALPAAASALIANHLNPTPAGTKTITGGGIARLSTTTGLTVTCENFHGTATFNAGGTTGSMSLTFSGDCKESLFGSTCTNSATSNSTITTTTLPFDLATVAPNKKPGVLVTPAAGEHFATFKCLGGSITTTVNGKGVIGTITAPECGKKSKTATISFKATSHGQQEDKELEGTKGVIYDLTSGGNTAAQEAHGTIDMNEEIELVCT